MVSGAPELRPLSRGYSREPAVEDDLKALLGLPAAARDRRLAIVDYKQPDCPHTESLVYLARHLLADGDDGAAWRVIEVLWRRSLKSVLKQLWKYPQLNADDREDATSELQVALATQWLCVDPAHEFWEVRFAVCLQREVADEIDRRLRIKQAEMSPEGYGTDDGNTSDPWGDIRDDNARDPEAAAIYREGLASLPEPERVVVFLYHCQDWSEAAIAKLEGVSERTVRNRLRRGEERLRTWWGGEGA